MLFAIGDLHLSENTNKSMEVFGGAWQDYTGKLAEGFSVLGENDVCVICGDVSWSMKLEDTAADFRWIDRFPGEKIILKGNHDYWWSTQSKVQKFFESNGLSTLRILHNNCYFYGEKFALCGTRGWFYEEETGGEHDKKMMRRELMRLEASLRAAEGAERKLVFLHYPPVFGKYRCEEMLELMRAYSVSDCYYGHLHGAAHRGAFEGTIEGIRFHDVAADRIGFRPAAVETETLYNPT